MRSWSQALVPGIHLPASSPPSRSQENGGREGRPQQTPNAPLSLAGPGDTLNDTHDCTTAPIINGRLPLHLLRQAAPRFLSPPSPPCGGEREGEGQPYRPSAFPRLNGVGTNHQRWGVGKTPLPFAPSVRPASPERKRQELVLDTKHLMPPPPSPKGKGQRQPP